MVSERRAYPTDRAAGFIRPRDYGALLDGAFRLYRGYFVTFLAIVAVVYVPAELLARLIRVALTGSPGDYAYNGDIWTYIFESGDELAGVLVYLTVTNLLPIIRDTLMFAGLGAATAGVRDMYQGSPLTVGGAYRAIQGRIPTLLAIMSVQALFLLWLNLPFGLLTVVEALGPDNAAAASVCLLPPAFVLSVYCVIRLRLAVPAAVVEGLGFRSALQRSWALVGGYWWRTFGLLFIVLSLLSIVVTIGPVLLVESLLDAFFQLDPPAWETASAATGTLLSMIYLPIDFIVVSLYYFDLRVRREGYDIESAIIEQYETDEPPRPEGYVEPTGQAVVGAVVDAQIEKSRLTVFSEGQEQR